jgi:hypothetical protein
MFLTASTVTRGRVWDKPTVAQWSLLVLDKNNIEYYVAVIGDKFLHFKRLRPMSDRRLFRCRSSGPPEVPKHIWYGPDKREARQPLLTSLSSIPYVSIGPQKEKEKRERLRVSRDTTSSTRDRSLRASEWIRERFTPCPFSVENLPNVCYGLSRERL